MLKSAASIRHSKAAEEKRMGGQFDMPTIDSGDSAAKAMAVDYTVVQAPENQPHGLGEAKSLSPKGYGSTFEITIRDTDEWL